MSFYLGVWKSLTAISDHEAARQYHMLSDGKSAHPKFEARVYAFYLRLTDLYAEIEMVPEDQLDACPWAGSIEMSGSHVIVAIQSHQFEKMRRQIQALSEQHDLVCFDPQTGKVNLPPSLRAGQGGAATGSA